MPRDGSNEKNKQQQVFKRTENLTSTNQISQNPAPTLIDPYDHYFDLIFSLFSRADADYHSFFRSVLPALEGDSTGYTRVDFWVK